MRRFDGVYGKTRAVIAEQYLHHPIRFFSIVTLVVAIGFGLKFFWGPITFQTLGTEQESALTDQSSGAEKAPSEDGGQVLGTSVQTAPENAFLTEDHVVIASDQPLEVEIPEKGLEPEVEVHGARTELSGKDDFTITLDDAGKGEKITITPNGLGAKPGLYEVVIKNPETGAVLKTEKIAWGVLAFNPDYAVYPPGTQANLAFAVLDDRGKMVCNADLTLEITNPDGGITTLRTADKTIVLSPDCQVYGPTSEPDYHATYQTGPDGQYRIKLVAKVGEVTRTLTDTFSVKRNEGFYLKRELPTRIYPPTTYEAKLIFQPKQNGTYQVEEFVPKGFEISETKAEIISEDTKQILRWSVEAQSNQDQTLSYRFKAPNISPYLFLVGPLIIENSKIENSTKWVEPRSWQIASDNACQSAATGNWSATGSWTSCGGTVPQAADTVQILNTHNITEDTASVTVAGVTIDNGGTLTVSTTNAITVSGNWSNSGTFTAASGTVTFSATTTGKTLSGTMTGATGKFYNVVFSGSGGGWTLQAAIEAANDFTVSAGTFDTKSGSNYAVTVTNDLSITGGTFTARNSTITVSRHWTLNTGATFTRGGSTVVLDGTGSILGTALTQFESLSIGYSGKTTTLAGSNNRVDTFGTLTLNGGTVTSSGAAYSFYMLKASAGTYSPLVFASATTLSGTSVTLYYRTIVTGITINIAAGDYGAWNVSPFASAGNSNTWNFAGDVTTTGTFQPFAATGITGTSVNTQNFALTAKRLSFGATGANLGPIALSLGSSAVTLSNGTSDAILMANVAVTHTLDMGSSSIDVKGNVLFVNGSASVTVTPGTSTLTWTNTSGTLTYAPNGQSLYNLVLNGSGSTVAPNAAVDIDNDLTMTAGTLNGTQNITVNGTVAGTAGIISLTGGTFEQRVATAENFGATSGSTAWTFSTLTFSNSSGAAATITTQTTGSGGITISSTLNVGKAADTAKTVFNAGNRTYTMSSTGGNPIIADADGNGSSITGSTSTFSLTGANASGNTTIEKNTGDSYYNITLNASDTFVLEGATTATGTVTITTGTLDTVAASSFALTAGAISIAASQTLTANNSTITLTGTSGTLFTNSGTFTQGDSTVIVTSASGTPTLLSAATTFHILTINAAATVVNAGAAITTDNDAGNKFYVQTGVFNLEGQTITPGTSGTLEVSSTGTFCLGGTTSATTATCDSGATQTSASTFPAFTTITLDATSTVIFLADAAQTVTNTPTYGNLTLKPTQTAARIYTMGGAMTINGNFDINPGTAANLLTVNPAGNITVASTKTTTIERTTSATATLDLNPGSSYNLSTGDLTISTGGTLDGTSATSTITVAGNYSNSGTFTAGSSTVTFSATDTGNTIQGTLSGSTGKFYNVIFGVSGSPDWTPNAAVEIGNDLTMTAGSLLGTQNLTVAGGDITGDGTINLTGGTTTLTADGNFGGATAWTFYTLKFGNTSSLVPVETVTATGAGGITVTDVLTINKHSGLGCDENTLNAGSKIWTLSGTTGSPLVVSGTLTPSTSTITFTGNNGSGNTNVPGSGAACGDATYNNLTLNNGSETFAVSGTTNITINSNLTITAGTFTAGSGTTTVKGNLANSGTFTANSGNVTLSGTSTQTISGTLTGGSAFYDLTISNSSGTDASDCELTSWVAGIDFAAAATVTNNYTITTASVRVEYNSGSTYTINNMNWNGQAVGTRLYFRNSAATGTWLLNVTAVGNAQTKVSYINVSRSDASGGAQIIASDGTNTDCGSNTNWQFDETLTLGLDTTSISFGTIQPGVMASNQTNVLTASSNSNSGYAIYAWATQAMTMVRGADSLTIADWTGTNPSPTTWSSGAGFGYTSDDTSVACTTGDVCDAGDRFGSGTKFAGFTNTGPGKIVADRTAPVTGATNTITYRLGTDATQAAGTYSTIVIYIISTTFP